MKICKSVLTDILSAWFEDGKYIESKKDRYGDIKYVGFHDERTSEVVFNTECQDHLIVYQIVDGGSFLSAFYSEIFDQDRKIHELNMQRIGMLESEHDFKFENERNYSECHTIITMIK